MKEKLPTYLRYAALLVAAIAVIMAFAGYDYNTSANSRVQPEAAIAMAIVSYVLLRASELRWT